MLALVVDDEVLNGAELRFGGTNHPHSGVKYGKSDKSGDSQSKHTEFHLISYFLVG